MEFCVLQLAFLQYIYILTLNYITDTISPDVVYFYFIVYMLYAIVNGVHNLDFSVTDTFFK